MSGIDHRHSGLPMLTEAAGHSGSAPDEPMPRGTPDNLEEYDDHHDADSCLQEHFRRYVNSDGAALLLNVRDFSFSHDDSGMTPAQLECDCAEPLLKLLPACPRATKLSFQNEDLAFIDGGAALARGVGCLPQLAELRLLQCWLRDRGTIAVAGALKSLVHLQVGAMIDRQILRHCNTIGIAAGLAHWEQRLQSRCSARFAGFSLPHPAAARAAYRHRLFRQLRFPSLEFC